MNAIEERKRERWLLLEGIYQEVGGTSELVTVDPSEVGEKRGLSPQVVNRTVSYLKGEGLIEIFTLAGHVHLTHAGVQEVEAAMEHPNRPTEHFPPQIIQITGSQNVNIGSGNTFTQTAYGSFAEAVTALRGQLQELDGGRQTPEADRLLSAVAAQEPQKAEIAAAAEAVAAKGGRWQTALQDFAAKAAGGGAASLVVKAIEYALH